jgi:hypothetical protein
MRRKGQEGAGQSPSSSGSANNPANTPPSSDVVAAQHDTSVVHKSLAGAPLVVISRLRRQPRDEEAEPGVGIEEHAFSDVASQQAASTLGGATYASRPVCITGRPGR